MMKGHKMTSLKEITNKFIDIDEDLRFQLLKKYLIEDQLFSRIQQKTKTTNKRCDLHYMIIPNSDKMYKRIEAEGELKSTSSRNKWKYIFADDIPSTYEMREDFIKRLDSTGFKEIWKDRKEIEDAIKKLDTYYEAIINKAIFPLMKLKAHGKHLSCYEKTIKELHNRTRERHLNDALRGLIDIIILNESK